MDDGGSTSSFDKEKTSTVRQQEADVRRSPMLPTLGLPTNMDI